ncbi:MAG: glycosyl transferase family 1, partial [Muribaculaceae bacterium]|nr:glycosyl transferase family 1 [Muribaculaceae bacterium]
VVSDIPANRLSCLSSEDFFKTGNVVSLQQKIEEKLSATQVGRTYDLGKYDWDKIAYQTVEVYRRIVSS